MNTPNPLVPQGTFPDKGKAQVRMTVFAILAVHVVLLCVLLIAGCNKKTQDPTAATDPTTGLPPVPPAPEPWPTPPTSAPPAQITQDPGLIPPVPPPPAVTQEVVQPLPPAPTPTPTVTPEPAFGGLVEHTIAKGESFYTLGKKYNVGYKAIAEANPGINPTRLKIGDKVKIPPARTPGSASLSGTPTAPADGGIKTYKVRSGDNLMKIAKTHGVTVKQLRAANNLRTDQIKVGQVLKIPAKPAEVPVEPAPPAVPPVTPPTGFPPPNP